MKNTIRKLVFTTAVFFAFCVGLEAQETSISLHWYYFHFDSMADVAATSKYSPKELADALSGGEYVEVSNIHTPKGDGSWVIQTPPRTQVMFVRPEVIRAFELMLGKPTDQ